MRWWFANGDQHKAAREAAGEDGVIPEALEPPELMEGFDGWYEDFWRLSTNRQLGFGVGPIPASAIDRHTEGWVAEDAEMFEFCIREMDGVYLMRANSSDDTAAQQGQVSPRDAFRAATAGQRRR